MPQISTVDSRPIEFRPDTNTFAMANSLINFKVIIGYIIAEYDFEHFELCHSVLLLLNQHFQTISKSSCILKSGFTLQVFCRANQSAELWTKDYGKGCRDRENQLIKRNAIFASHMR